jgi:hypothetical protein
MVYLFDKATRHLIMIEMVILMATFFIVSFVCYLKGRRK